MKITDEMIQNGFLVLVNKENGLNRNYQKNLAMYSEEYTNMLLNKTALEKLHALLKEIQAKEEIVPVSAWRSYGEQEDIWNSCMEKDGEEFTRKYVAEPGHSEHETGLAIDLGKNSDHIDFICPDFPYEGICQRFREQMSQFGFIERYEKKKEKITGIGQEPWHFRYVGKVHATIIKNYELALEEYIAWVKQFQYGKNAYEICIDQQTYRISFAKQNQEIQLVEGGQYEISGNNQDGIIITERC